MPKLRPEIKFRELSEDYALSFLPKAPDHGKPELAFVDKRKPSWRFVVLATGAEAVKLWDRAPSLAEALALADTVTHREKQP